MADQHSHPPKLALRFFRWFCRPEYLEDIEGDLIERFYQTCNEKGIREAKLKLTLDVIRLFRPGIVKQIKGSQKLSQSFMIKNHFKVSVRNLYRNKQYAVINILGLTIAMGIALALFSIIKFEHSFDTFHSNYDRVYQITRYGKLDDGVGSHIPYGIIHSISEKIPEVEIAGAVLQLSPPVLEVNSKKIKHNDGVFFIEPSILEMIDINWISGSPKQSLNSPNQVVLDLRTAKKLFGNQDPLGKIIRYDNTYDLVVSGIIGKTPANSDFQFQMLISMETRRLDPDYWETKDYFGGGDSSHHGYVLLQKGADKKTVETKLDLIWAEHPDDYERVGFELITLNDIHFNQGWLAFNYQTPKWMMKSFIYIGVFLILIACINFINLATSLSIKRNKEIAVRKIIGGSRLTIIGQFMMEAGLLVTISVILAVCICNLILNYSNEFLNTGIASAQIWDSSSVLFLLGLILTVTITAGLYPSITSSSLKPISALQKRNFSLSTKIPSLRQVLVIGQFVIAQVMLIGVIVGLRQMDYFYSTELGFNTESIVTVDMPEKGNKEKREFLKTQLLRHPEILDVTFALSPPSSLSNQWWATMSSPGIPDKFGSRVQYVDLNYFDFFGIDLLEGREFYHSDTGKYTIVNEQTVKAMGLGQPKDAIGKTIEGWPGNFTIIGVVRDFHSQSLKDKIVPHFYLYGPWNFQTASISIQKNSMTSGISYLEDYWTNLFSNNLFEYYFLSSEMKKFYEDEKRISNFLRLFAVASILIGSMGLYGLVYFVCLSRSKEFGIRKVLGSGTVGILGILSKDFLKLVAIAFVISVPIGWFLTNTFLQNYSYRIIISWVDFAKVGLITAIITVIALGSQSLKAALDNPINALRDE